MKTVGEIQRSGQIREVEANKLRKEAENRLMDLISENSFLLHEKEMIKDALDQTKDELLRTQQINHSLGTELEKLKYDIGTNSSTLQMERELRARSEQKEKDERNERIAISAQMVAMTKEHTQLESSLRQTHETEISKVQGLLQEKEIYLEEKHNELVLSNERIACLEAEIKSLIGSINEQKTIAEAKNAEEISQLRGQINLLNERLRTEEKKSHIAGVASAELLKELQEEKQAWIAERRRCVSNGINLNFMSILTTNTKIHI